ncbi:hypothetical protein Hanom_Chr03g00271131 [Helianthus anomalus]
MTSLKKNYILYKYINTHHFFTIFTTFLLLLPYLFIFCKINPQHPTMHPYNRDYDANNPFGYQENPNPSPPPNRPPHHQQIPITHGHPQQPQDGIVYSPCPNLARITSHIGDRLYTNFPYDDSPIPMSQQQIPITLFQPESVPKTQPQDVGGSS